MEKEIHSGHEEKLTCGAPMFITGCDYSAAAKDDGCDVCTCRTGECPWTHHTGTFL